MLSAEHIQSMDLETAMLAVQSNRANLLETQLKDQIASVQAKNEQISKLNALMGTLNAVAAKFKTQSSAGDTLAKQYNDKDELKNRADNLKGTLNDHLAAAGIKPLDLMPSGKHEVKDSKGNKTGAVTFDINTVSKGELEGVIAQLKGNIDSMSNTQQMDMLRLQSLSNKRNEAFDLMSNFIKKMQDSRSSILGNMR